MSSTDKIELHSVQHHPLNVGSYIPTPKGLNGLVNVENYDYKCILWAMIAQLYPAAQNLARLSHYIRHADKIDCTGVRFPTPIKDISKLEELNNFSIHVFSYEPETGITPFRLSKVEKTKHFNLLLLTENENHHYVLIKSFHLLMKQKRQIFVTALIVYNLSVTALFWIIINSTACVQKLKELNFLAKKK